MIKIFGIQNRDAIVGGERLDRAKSESLSLPRMIASIIIEGPFILLTMFVTRTREMRELSGTFMHVWHVWLQHLSTTTDTTYSRIYRLN